MKTITISVLVMLLYATGITAGQQQQKTNSQVSKVVPAHLRCEYLVDPHGIDVLKPRLSWVVTDGSHARGQEQIAYQIIVSSAPQNLKTDAGDLWDTKKIVSSQTNQIEYVGKPLTSRLHCYWKVRVWDKDDRVSKWSSPATWTMGLLQEIDWHAQWIGARPIALTGEKEKDSITRLMIPSPLLRKQFEVGSEISRATLYVTALGLYEVRIDGRKVGDHVLAPEWTDYDKRIQYQTYDVTSYLKQGSHALTAMLADGWYIGPVGTFSDPVTNRGRSYGSLDRKLLLQLEIETKDGSVARVCSDPSWRVNRDGPIRSADIYLGETWDGRKNSPGWEMPEFDDSGWEPASVYPSGSGKLVAQMNEPVRVVEEVHPVGLTQPADSISIFDMGQNMVGWCAMKLHEPKGTKITLRYGEMLDEKGNLYTANLRAAAQTDIFISDGKNERTFEPKFTYHGFRFVEISGLSNRPTLDDIVGKSVSSDVQSTGRFECSNSSLNRLWENIRWTQRDNLVGIPTDCPQRDERLGWMADAQVFSQAAILNSDMAAFYTKWSQDIRDAQAVDGQYPDVAPQPSAFKSNGAPAWADAGIIVPWRVYQNYGDARILEDHYASAKRFVDFLHSKNPKLIRTEAVGNQYGDWLNGNTIKSEGYPNNNGQIPNPVFNTIYFYASANILSQMAAILRHEDDAKSYAKLAGEIRDTLLKEFVDEKGVIKGNTQAGYALALGFDMLPDNLKPKAVEHLLECVREYDFRISTGFLSTIKMMNELVRRGHPDVAYGLLVSHRFPSWLYQIDQGATTIWERWDGYVKGRGFQDPGMNSFNHYAIGSVGEFMYKQILGIQLDEKHPGYGEFIIHPHIGGGLTWVKGAYTSINGEIVSEWKYANGEARLHVEIPPNTSAIVYLPTTNEKSIRESDGDVRKSRGVKLLNLEQPDAVALRVSAGSYDFVSEYKKESR